MKKVRVAVDALGGDFGLSVTIPAIASYLKTNNDAEIIIVGNKTIISNLIDTKYPQIKNKVEITHASDEVLMTDKATVALKKKKNSSMRLAVEQVKNSTADICLSAGNTGALMAISHYVLRPLTNISRPAIMGVFPTISNGEVYVLDLGANSKATSDNLYQFAHLANFIWGSQNTENKARVALLNIGHEDIKGTDEIKSAAEMLKSDNNINYIGYVESSELLFDKADVIVCDGFSGNIMLKSCEGMVSLIKQKLKDTFSARPFLGLLVKSSLQKSTMNYSSEQRNGALFVGLNGLVVKCHGNAGQVAFLNSLAMSVKTALKFRDVAYQQAASSILQESNTK